VCSFEADKGLGGWSAHWPEEDSVFNLTQIVLGSLAFVGLPPWACWVVRPTLRPKGSGWLECGILLLWPRPALSWAHLGAPSGSSSPIQSFFLCQHREIQTQGSISSPFPNQTNHGFSREG
jgi:hypothetical protein